MDILLNIDHDQHLTTKIYDKRDDFEFSIVNFPFLISNIPEPPAYGVYISQLIRYSIACSDYQDFLIRGRLLTSKLLRYNRDISHINSGMLLVTSMGVIMNSWINIICQYHRSLLILLCRIFVGL